MKLIGKIKNGFHSAIARIGEVKDEYVLCRIFINKYTIVFIAFLLWISFFDNNSVGIFIKANSTIRQQVEQIDNLNDEISATKLRIEQLHSKKDTLERFAREEYLFHEKEETVYLIK